MTREIAYSSPDLRYVEPPLVPSSGGSHPQAAVAWEELQSALTDFVDESSLERALSSLFFDVLLTGGVTDQRPATEGSSSYFYTRFEMNLPVLTGNPLWLTRRITDDALLDNLGNRISYSYNFQVIGNGLVAVEFQGSSSPVIPDNQLTLIVQRRPVSNITRSLLAGDSITFVNGARLLVRLDNTFSMLNGDGSLFYEAPIDWIPPIKANPEKGIIKVFLDGVIRQETLVANTFAQGVVRTQADFDSF